MRTVLLTLGAALLVASSATAQTSFPRLLTAPHGVVVIPAERDLRAYEAFKYAPARLVGDDLYVSGVIVARRRGEGVDLETFKVQVRRAFKTLDQILKASGASFDDVVMINSFHVWEGPDQPAPRLDQFTAFNEVKSEFITGPQPAWTAVGSTGLLEPGGIVEIQLIARRTPKHETP